MKKVIILLGLVMVLGMSLTGCFGGKESVWKTKQEIRVENFNRIFNE